MPHPELENASRRFAITRITTFLVAAPVFSTSAAAAAGSEQKTTDAIDTLFAALAQPAGSKARFHEIRRLGDLEIPVESTGHLSFDPPDRLTKTTERPIEEVLQLDGNRLSVTLGGQTRELPIDAVPAAGALAKALRGVLAGNRNDVDSAFEITLSEASNGWTMRLEPREWQLAASIASIEFLGRDERLATIIIRQANGDESQMQILDAP